MKQKVNINCIEIIEGHFYVRRKNDKVTLNMKLMEFFFCLTLEISHAVESSRLISKRIVRFTDGLSL